MPTSTVPTSAVQPPRADLTGAFLIHSDLRDADLSRAFLGSALLRYAKLSRANLSRAVLGSAFLNCADLSGANLSYANARMDNLWRC